MRCQLGFHDQSKKSLVLFFQEKSAVFSKTVFGLEGALVEDSPSALQEHVRKSGLSN